MSIKVLELVKYSELGNLSIDEQKIIVGGGSSGRGSTGPSYPADLKGYADGKLNISSSGDIVTFTPINYDPTGFELPWYEVPRSYTVSGDKGSLYNPNLKDQ